ncbi:hypothetical protein FDB39_17125 [Clostridium botulinum]|nr:hypothetical protein [Clostridium botulinum]
MSDGIVSDIAIMILIVILVLVGPIYQNFETADRLMSSMVTEIINNYQKEIRKSGYIDQETYLNLLNDLCVTGEVYEVKMVHTSRLVYPSTTTSDEYEIHEVKYGQDLILDTIKDGTTKYTMRYGDNFKIEVKETKVPPSRLLSNIFHGSGRETLMSYPSGGMVENEVYE